MNVDNILEWLPIHQAKADKARIKMNKGGSKQKLWSYLYYYHNDMALRMEENLYNYSWSE